MKKFSPLQKQLLHCLADGQYHTNHALSLELNASHTVISQNIKPLMDLEIPIEYSSQQGYRLNMPLQLLDESIIHHRLISLGFHEPIDLHVFASLDSTNRFLKETPKSTTLALCCAEMQTAGRGRFGRHWHSPFGENIYFSSRWYFGGCLSRLSGLGLVVSLSVVATLKDLGIEESIAVKWPNDILWQHRKLCGNLIEITTEGEHAHVIIGIGLNVNSLSATHDIAGKPWCSIYDIIGHYTDRNKLIAKLLVYLQLYINKFIQEGFAAFINQWSTVDYLYDQSITILNSTGVLRGKANGVNLAGQLLLIDEAGITHTLSSGDTSLQL